MASTRRPSLDALANTLTINQASGNTNPREPTQQITVDRDAGIQLGDTPGNQSERTQLAQDTYSGWFSSESRQDKERRIVSKKLPRNTKALKTEEGTDGWLYSFNCQMGQPYTMFLFYDGAYYQVMVISPRVEERFRSPETGHVYSDGRICMSRHYNGGQPTLDGAFAKSALWATGFTAASQGGIPFPFNHNQRSA